MKFGIHIFILFIILSGLTNCKKESNNILYDKKYIKEIKAARKDMGLYLTRNQIPGATVAVSKNGKIIYSEGIGLVIASITNLSTGNEHAPLFKMVEHFIERDTIE
jgi:serine beta-lactamase-like protein LACTB, mitochondrial